MTTHKPTSEAERLQMLADIAKESQRLAKIMKDFADKNPKSLMLKDFDAAINAKGVQS